METRAVVAAAFRSWLRSPVRSALTTLGVVVGAAAVVAMASIGNGAKERIQAALATPDSRVIYLGAMATSGANALAAKLGRNEGLRVDDYYAMRGVISGVSAVSPQIYLLHAPVRFRARQTDALVEGIDVDGFELGGRQLLEGDLFSAYEVAKRDRVCVVSRSLSKMLEGDGRQVIGAQINIIKNLACWIIGVVDDSPTFVNAATDGADKHIYIPFTTILMRLDKEARININFQVARIADMERVRREVSDLIEKRRGHRTAEFVTNSRADGVRAYEDGSKTVAKLLAIVGGVALVVGGIGIMNIMLVCVAERRREIGVRIALGTRRRHILGQFLAEAVVLSLCGGVLGAFLGSLFAQIITVVNGWPTSVTTLSITEAVCCCVIVGIAFGCGPARRAAGLDPIDGLRAD